MNYHPKRIVVKAKLERAALLLLNDKFDPKWKEIVDGQVKRL
jgi:hypothetical protein